MDPVQRTDDELLAAWRTGDAVAADALFSRHFDALYRFFRNKVDDASDDLVQRTLLACFEGRERFRGECSFRTYLFAIARNQLLVFLAAKRSNRVVDPATASVADAAPSPSEVLSHRREQALVLHALRHLAIDHQVLLELFYWEQLSGPELAEVLGVAEGTIRTRLRRARQLLAAEIEAVGASPELLQSTLSDLDGWAAKLRASQ